MIRNGMARKIAFQQQKVREAEDIEQLKQRWSMYPSSVQEMLKMHLKLYGLSSAQDATALLAHYSRCLLDRLTGNETKE